MKSISKYIIINKILITPLLIGQLLFPFQVFAQDIIPSDSPSLTPASIPSPALSVSPSAALTPPVALQAVPTITVDPPGTASTSSSGLQTIPSLVPTLASSRNTNSSATIRKHLSFIRSQKRNFKSDEPVSIKVLNRYENELDVSLTHQNGSRVPFIMDKKTDTDETEYTFSPLSNFIPGKYTLTMKDEKGDTFTQDFTWGVLALNPNKSIYSTGETANLAIAVLDETGNMVCNADVTLEITAPGGQKTVLATSDGKIIINKECTQRAITIVPDYETQYQIGSENGTYNIVLTAETKNGKFSINDSFQVDENALFDVSRLSATRIFPPRDYPMHFEITAREDFDGTVVETVPESFKINPISNEGVLNYNEISTVSAVLKNSSSLVNGKIPQIRFPFQGYYPITLNFAEIPDSTYLQSQYEKFGANAHDGIDFAVPLDSKIVAVDDGEVSFAGPGDYGITSIVNHSWGNSFYGHLATTSAGINQKVSKGDVLGLSGNTGLSTGPHLHFSIESNSPDLKNGFRGKENPAPLLGLDQEGLVTGLNLGELNDQKIIWRLNLKKGESVKLGYLYQTPHTTPQFYLLGPLEFRSSAENPGQLSLNGNQDSSGSAQIRDSKEDSTLVFREQRQWQIAADAAVTIDDTANVTTQMSDNAATNTVFISDEVGYVFYNDSNGQCVYKKTLDSGATWSSAVGVDAQTDCLKVAVWYDRWTPGDNYGYNIHIAFNDSGNDDLWYAVLDTRTDTLSTSVSIAAPADSDSAGGSYPAITRGRDGDLYAGVSDSIKGLIVKCSSSCTSGVNWSDTNVFPDISVPNDNGDDDDNNWVLMPLIDNNIIIIMVNDNPTNPTTSHALLYDIFTDSSGTWSGTWTQIGSSTSVANSSIYEPGVSAVVDRTNNNIYVVFKNNDSTLGGDDDIMTASYDGSTWTTSHPNIITDSGSAAGAGTGDDICAGVTTCGITGAYLAIDEKTGYLYAVYSARNNAADAATAHVYWRSSTDGMTNWSDEQGPISANDDNLHGLNVNILSSERIFASWVDETLDDIIGNTVSSVPLLPYYLRHGEYIESGRNLGTTY